MLIRHDALLEVTLTSGDLVLDRTTVQALYLDAHCTVRSIMYNANPYSGGGLWWDPTTGMRISRPKVSWKLLYPDQDTLKSGELCDCAHCLGGSLPSVAKTIAEHS